MLAEQPWAAVGEGALPSIGFALFHAQGQWPAPTADAGQLLPFHRVYGGRQSLAGLFSPFPTFFSFSFPFHPHHISHQVSPSLDLPFTLGTSEG